MTSLIGLKIPFDCGVGTIIDGWFKFRLDSGREMIVPIAHIYSQLEKLYPSNPNNPIPTNPPPQARMIHNTAPTPMPVMDREDVEDAIAGLIQLGCRKSTAVNGVSKAVAAGIQGAENLVRWVVTTK